MKLMDKARQWVTTDKDKDRVEIRRSILVELTVVAASHDTVVLELQPAQRMVVGLFRLRFVVRSCHVAGVIKGSCLP